MKQASEKNHLIYSRLALFFVLIEIRIQQY